MAASRAFLRQLGNFATVLKPSSASKLTTCRSTVAVVNQVPHSITFSRNISQKELEIEEAKQMSWFNWLLERFNTIVDPPEKVQTEDELQERQELLNRIQACYYTKPPGEPGKEFFIEAFHLLIKYDDWRAVEALWRFSEMNGHEFDDDLLDKIEDYLLDARKRRWYED
ncbi:uncharacterized protein LOC130654706 isoform X2 [Hydractinia symbiolongicarpus]|uniref:uncharacterized protein LOC130654706 isoform X2 n=1 Tax=Hydractinia symbiolongicarpus TaxID=13093 RepID=UPI00254A272E|nr:uncharacterized protein LOC130654706 isoform X2 [Hydractinia symbiolongicarpus]